MSKNVNVVDEQITSFVKTMSTTEKVSNNPNISNTAYIITHIGPLYDNFDNISEYALRHRHSFGKNLIGILTLVMHAFHFADKYEKDTKNSAQYDLAADNFNKLIDKCRSFIQNTIAQENKKWEDIINNKNTNKTKKNSNTKNNSNTKTK